jgi:hypothetical protein
MLVSGSEVSTHTWRPRVLTATTNCCSVCGGPATGRTNGPLPYGSQARTVTRTRCCRAACSWAPSKRQWTARAVSTSMIRAPGNYPVNVPRLRTRHLLFQCPGLCPIHTTTSAHEARRCRQGVGPVGATPPTFSASHRLYRGAAHQASSKPSWADRIRSRQLHPPHPNKTRPLSHKEFSCGNPADIVLCLKQVPDLIGTLTILDG